MNPEDNARSIEAARAADGRSLSQAYAEAGQRPKRDSSIKVEEKWALGIVAERDAAVATLRMLADAVTNERCNGCRQPRREWGPICGGMTQGDYTHFHSASWWARAALAEIVT